MLTSSSWCPLNVPPLPPPPDSPRPTLLKAVPKEVWGFDRGFSFYKQIQYWIPIRWSAIEPNLNLHSLSPPVVCVCTSVITAVCPIGSRNGVLGPGLNRLYLWDGCRCYSVVISVFEQRDSVINDAALQAWPTRRASSLLLNCFCI